MVMPKPGEVWERDGERREVQAVDDVSEYVRYKAVVYVGAAAFSRMEDAPWSMWNAWANPPPAPPSARLVRTADGKVPADIQLDNLTDWFVEDITSMSDEELLAEAREDREQKLGWHSVE